MEIAKGGQTLVGFPALIDKGAHVEIEVFDEPDVAAAQAPRRPAPAGRAAAARRAQVPREEHPRPAEDGRGLHAARHAPTSCATQIVDVALDRAFLAEPLPTDAAAFERRIDEGRGRLTLIANEVARLAGAVLAEYAAALRKLKDTRPPKEVADDVAPQLQRLVPKRFLADTPWARLQHLPRYLKAIALRLDKLRADPARDAQRLAELRPLEQRYLRKLAERRGARDARLDEFRWLLEELRVSLFAQELRTPQPVSVKRLDKIWAQAFA